VHYVCVQSVEDVAANPSLIVDAIPFIAATDPSLNSTSLPLLSWQMSEIFEWATYEGMPLDVSLVRHNTLQLHRACPGPHHKTSSSSTTSRSATASHSTVGNVMRSIC